MIFCVCMSYALCQGTAHVILRCRYIQTVRVYFSCSLCVCVCVVQEVNRVKIESELLDRIRVVSGYSFGFPIWIDGDVVPVRVGTCRVLCELFRVAGLQTLPVYLS